MMAEDRPETMTLEIGGRELTFVLFDLNLISEFEELTRQRKIALALEALGPDAPSTERIQVVGKLAIAPVNPEADMTTAGGLRLALWLNLRQNQPEMSEEEVGRLINSTSLDDLDRIVTALGGSLLPGIREAADSESQEA